MEFSLRNEIFLKIIRQRKIADQYSVNIMLIRGKFQILKPNLLSVFSKKFEFMVPTALPVQTLF